MPTAGAGAIVVENGGPWMLENGGGVHWRTSYLVEQNDHQVLIMVDNNDQFLLRVILVRGYRYIYRLATTHDFG